MRMSVTCVRVSVIGAASHEVMCGRMVCPYATAAAVMSDPGGSAPSGGLLLEACLLPPLPDWIVDLQWALAGRRGYSQV